MEQPMNCYKNINIIIRLRLFSVFIFFLLVNFTQAYSQYVQTKLSSPPSSGIVDMTQVDDKFVAITDSGWIYFYDISNDIWIRETQMPFIATSQIAARNSEILFFLRDGRVYSYNIISQVKNQLGTNNTLASTQMISDDSFMYDVLCTDQKMYTFVWIEKTILHNENLAYLVEYRTDSIQGDSLFIGKGNFYSGIVHESKLYFLYDTKYLPTNYSIMEIDPSSGYRMNSVEIAKVPTSEVGYYPGDVQLVRDDDNIFITKQFRIDRGNTTYDKWDVFWNVFTTRTERTAWVGAPFFTKIYEDNLFLLGSKGLFYKFGIDPSFSIPFSLSPIKFSTVNYEKFSSVFPFDYDNDLDLDILLFNGNLSLYQNNSANLNLVSKYSFIEEPWSAVTLADVQNDGRLEFLGSHEIKKSWDWSVSRVSAATIAANGQFTEFDLLGQANASWNFPVFDADNNGRLDLFFSVSEQAQYLLFKNFNDAYIPTYSGTEPSTFMNSWAFDIDQDGYQDIIASKDNANSMVLRNRGNGLFDLIGHIGFPYHFGSAIAYADLNNDGQKEFIYANGPRRNKPKLYQLIPSAGDYKSLEVPGSEGLYENEIINDVLLGDLNNDGRMDIIAGYNTTSRFNNRHAIALADVDGDGDLDIIATIKTRIFLNGLQSFHYAGELVPTADQFIFINQNQTKNFPPSIPNGIVEKTVEDQCTISWGASTDDHDTHNIRYAVKIGTSIGSGDVLSGAHIFDSASLTFNHFQYIQNLKPGNYFVSIQAIDAAGSESAWSSSLPFSITKSDMTPPQPIKKMNGVAYQPFSLKKRSSSSKDIGAGFKLSWKNPADPDFMQVLIVKNSSHVPKDTSDGEIIYRTTCESLIDSSVTANQNYYYSAFALDECHNISSLAEDSHLSGKVENDFPPEIQHIPIRYADRNDQHIDITAIVDEDILLDEVLLYYRPVGESSMNTVKMHQDGRRIWKSLIPIPVGSQTEEIEYWIMASDGHNISWFPADYQINPIICHILSSTQNHEFLSGRVYDLHNDRPIRARLKLLASSTGDSVVTRTDENGYYKLFLPESFSPTQDTLCIDDYSAEYYRYHQSVAYIKDNFSGNIALLRQNKEAVTGKDFLDITNDNGYLRPIYSIYDGWDEARYFDDVPFKVFIDTTYKVNDAHQVAFVDSIKKGVRAWEDSVGLRLFQFVDHPTSHGITVHTFTEQAACGYNHDADHFIIQNFVTGWWYNNVRTTTHEFGHAMGLTDVYYHSPVLDGVMGDGDISFQEKSIIKMKYLIPNYTGENGLKTSYSHEIRRFAKHAPLKENHAPTLQIVAESDTFVVEQPQTIKLLSEDPDGDQVLYSLKSSTPACRVDVFTGNVEWFPSRKSSQKVTVIFAVTDGELVTIDSLNVFLRNAVGVEDNLSQDQLYSYELKQNYPNPFNSSTTIEFYLSKTEEVRIRWLSLLGKEVKELVHERMNAGNHKVALNCGDLASGVYFIVYEAGPFRQMRKAVLMR